MLNFGFMSDLLKKILTFFLRLWTNLAHTSPLKCVGLEQVSWSKVNVIVDRGLMKFLPWSISLPLAPFCSCFI